MLEHFKQRCKEGELYSVQGLLPETRFLQDCLVPRSRQRRAGLEAQEQSQGSPRPQAESFEACFDVPDAIDPLLMDGSDSQLAEPVCANASDEPVVFMQVPLCCSCFRVHAVASGI